LRAFATWALLAAAVPAAAGTVTGKVELIEKGSRKATDLSDVVVYVDDVKVKPKAAKPPSPAAVMTMKGKAFTPRVVAVPVGGTVEFPNEDPILHNAFSVSGDNKFDLELYKRPKSGSHTFDHAGVVRVYCNIHPQMSGVVLVRDNPYFTKAAADGTFTIEGVPPGKHTVKAWHERASEVDTTVNVPAEGPVTAKLTLDASSFKQVAHKNKFGKDYESGEKY
jgi:plastocyanin